MKQTIAVSVGKRRNCVDHLDDKKTIQSIINGHPHNLHPTCSNSKYVWVTVMVSQTDCIDTAYRSYRSPDVRISVTCVGYSF